MKAVYIDVQNVHRKTLDYNRRIDWKKFFVYLTDKYKVNVVYYAVWYVKQYDYFYKRLKSIGYTLLFKDTITLPNGEIKGNVDIDIAIKSILDLRRESLQEAYLITNDGDYNSLMKVLIQEWVFAGLIVPDRRSASRLIKDFNRTILDLQEIKTKISL